MYNIYSSKGNYKPFRIIKNGANTGVFETIPIEEEGENNEINNNIHENEIQNNGQNNNNVIRINIERNEEREVQDKQIEN